MDFLLAEQRMKNKAEQLLPKYKHGNEMIVMNRENSKTSKPHKFVP